LAVVDGERARFETPQPDSMVTAEKILELAKRAENLYKSQAPAEQRRLLETVLSNCIFDSGSLYPTYSSPFDLLMKGNETGDWRAVWDGFRNWIVRASSCGKGTAPRASDPWTLAPHRGASIVWAAPSAANRKKSIAAAETTNTEGVNRRSKSGE
jgi:hypothetical protein